MSRIFLYWISVSIASVFFIFFSTRYAKFFNLKKWEAFAATILFSILSLTFPVFLQKGKILLWGILTCGVFTLFLGMIGVKMRAFTRKEWAPEVSRGLGEDNKQNEGELPTEEEKILKTEEISSIEETLSIEELLERGFNAKEAKKYDLAAESFLQAIAQNPPPDILFYLITDTYWLWKIGHSVQEAADKVKPYFEYFLRVAPREWQIQFMVWLEKEGLIDTMGRNLE